MRNQTRTIVFIFAWRVSLVSAAVSAAKSYHQEQLRPQILRNLQAWTFADHEGIKILHDFPSIETLNLENDLLHNQTVLRNFPANDESNTVEYPLSRDIEANITLHPFFPPNITTSLGIGTEEMFDAFSTETSPEISYPSFISVADVQLEEANLSLSSNSGIMQSESVISTRTTGFDNLNNGISAAIIFAEQGGENEWATDRASTERFGVPTPSPTLFDELLLDVGVTSVPTIVDENFLGSSLLSLSFPTLSNKPTSSGEGSLDDGHTESNPPSTLPSDVPSAISSEMTSTPTLVDELELDVGVTDTPTIVDENFLDSSLLLTSFPTLSGNPTSVGEGLLEDRRTTSDQPSTFPSDVPSEIPSDWPSDSTSGTPTHLPSMDLGEPFKSSQPSVVTYQKDSVVSSTRPTWDYEDSSDYPSALGKSSGASRFSDAPSLSPSSPQEILWSSVPSTQPTIGSTTWNDDNLKPCFPGLNSTTQNVTKMQVRFSYDLRLTSSDFATFSIVSSIVEGIESRLNEAVFAQICLLNDKENDFLAIGSDPTDSIYQNCGDVCIVIQGRMSFLLPIESSTSLEESSCAALEAIQNSLQLDYVNDGEGILGITTTINRNAMDDDVSCTLKGIASSQPFPSTFFASPQNTMTQSAVQGDGKTNELIGGETITASEAVGIVVAATALTACAVAFVVYRHRHLRQKQFGHISGRSDPDVEEISANSNSVAAIVVNSFATMDDLVQNASDASVTAVHPILSMVSDSTLKSQGDGRTIASLMEIDDSSLIFDDDEELVAIGAQDKYGSIDSVETEHYVFLT
jgi:hypothetical protein